MKVPSNERLSWQSMTALKDIPLLLKTLSGGQEIAWGGAEPAGENTKMLSLSQE